VKSWIPWLLAGGLAAGCSVDTPPQRPNVLCLVVDSLRSDEVSPERTPALESLKQRGVAYERAYATSSWNMPAVASLLTGLGPRQHGVERIEDRLAAGTPTLAGALGRAGYATSGVVSDFRLGRARGFDQGFEAFDDDAARGDDAVTTPDVLARATRELDRLAADEGRPFFLFVHFYDPHAAYLDRDEPDWADPQGTSLRGGEPIEELRLIGDSVTEAQARFVRALHAEEVWQTDRALGELVARLGELGVDDETVVVATASHGQELFDRADVGSATSLFEEQIHVPLVIRSPGGLGRVVTEPVSTASVAPTVLAMAGAPAIGTAPVLGAPRGGDREPVVAELDYVAPLAVDPDAALQLSAIVEKRFKLVHDVSASTAELFDLTVDPLERLDIARSYPGEVERLLTALESRSGSLIVRQ